MLTYGMDIPGRPSSKLNESHTDILSANNICGVEKVNETANICEVEKINEIKTDGVDENVLQEMVNRMPTIRQINREMCQDIANGVEPRYKD
jgi:hypothetical protein